MKLIAQDGGRRFWYLKIGPPYDQPIPGFERPFVTVVLACDPNITPDEQYTVSERLVAADCRYMCAWGFNSTSWDDSVDYAYIFSDPDLNPTKDRFVMTTWHDDDTIEEVIQFAINFTNFDVNVFNEYLLLMIGDDSRVESEAHVAVINQLLSS